MIFGNTEPATTQTVEFWLSLVEIAISLGLVAVLGATIRFYWNRYRWRLFKRSVDTWIETTVITDPADDRHPNQMNNEDWMVLCENILSNSQFSPFESHQMIDLAVVTAKGIVTSKLF